MSFVGNALNNVAVTNANMVVITSNTTYTPPDNLIYAEVVAIGGGGGSGGRTSGGVGTISIGQGGGGGGTAIKIFSKSDLMPNVSVTIGSGGAAGSAGANPGGTGGTTTFATSTPLTCNGGAGGEGTTSGSSRETDQVDGGNATGGDLNFQGGSCFSSQYALGTPQNRQLAPGGRTFLSMGGMLSNNTSGPAGALPYGGGAGTGPQRFGSLRAGLQRHGLVDLQHEHDPAQHHPFYHRERGHPGGSPDPGKRTNPKVRPRPCQSAVLPELQPRHPEVSQSFSRMVPRDRQKGRSHVRPAHAGQPQSRWSHGHHHAPRCALSGRQGKADPRNLHRG